MISLPVIIFFLSSGLFLGWSLGANDAANVFGSAVGSKMVSFRKAVVVLSIFVILGAVFQGSGASHTLGKLGAVDAIAGAFTVAFAAAITVFAMTKYNLPVSTSQAIVGAIIGWNLFSGNQTDYGSLTKIVSTWVLSPILGAAFAIILHLLMKFVINKSKIHLLRLDKYLRNGLLLVGAFGSFSLGANNIANVMGVFVTAVAPEKSINLGLFILSGTQQLFLLGGIAIAIGAITYSKKIMKTVGNNILQLSSESALVVVLAHSLVLFVFSSQSLQSFIMSLGLPKIPLVPVSSSQAIVGAILGVGLLKQAREIKFNVIGGIATGWITTPIMAGLISFFSLFFMSNVFNLEVAKPNSLVRNEMSEAKVEIVEDGKISKDSYLDERLNIIDSVKVDSSKTIIYKAVEDTQNNHMEFSNGSIISQDDDSISFAKQFLIILGGVTILMVIGTIFYYYKRKKEENKELQEKTEQIEESQKAYMVSELENTKILNESLETELEFQKKELTNLALNLIKKNEFLEDIQILVKEIKLSEDIEEKEKNIDILLRQINQSMNIDKERKTFYLHIEETNNDFFLKLQQSFPTLTLKEKQLAALLRLNLSSKEIAHLQNISPKSVEMNRYRLRQKMNIESGDSLTEFINKL
jgi:phosphate/sulfate permease/DNA-binding CsgD family transcriptional regulator